MVILLLQVTSRGTIRSEKNAAISGLLKEGSCHDVLLSCSFAWGLLSLFLTFVWGSCNISTPSFSWKFLIFNFKKGRDTEGVVMIDGDDVYWHRCWTKTGVSLSLMKCLYSSTDGNTIWYKSTVLCLITFCIYQRCCSNAPRYLLLVLLYVIAGAISAWKRRRNHLEGLRELHEAG